MALLRYVIGTAALLVALAAIVSGSRAVRAHILPDWHPRGEPVVPNGLALCKLHHAAFDGHLLGVRPDLTVELRLDVLREPDGPMLKYGLQGFQDARLQLPRDPALRPNLEFVKLRYGMFRKAG